MQPQLPLLPPIGAPKYTQVPDVLFSHYIRALPHGELAVLLVIIRHTFGWHRTEVEMSVRNLMTHTALSERSVRRATAALESRGLLRSYTTCGALGQGPNRYVLIVEEEAAPKPSNNANGRAPSSSRSQPAATTG